MRYRLEKRSTMKKRLTTKIMPYMYSISKKPILIKEVLK